MKFVLLSAALAATTQAKPLLGGYFANWAQYHPAPYNFSASSVEPLINSLDHLSYSFAYFCPTPAAIQPYWVTELGYCEGKQPFELITVEPKDEEFLQTLKDLRTKHNSSMKLIASVGGWNFPSAFWSDMVSTAASRSTFVASVQSFMQKYGFDGVDLDWEYPCSAPRTNPVQISCDFFYSVEDAGSNCPADKDNLLVLTQELRAALGPNAIITVASQAGMDNARDGFHLAEMSNLIDHYNIMSYDYSVSDIEDSSANVTAPNMPLFSPSVAGVPAWGVDYTVQGYLSEGVPANKIVLGVALYGHTWYTPGLKGDEWKTFGVASEVQGECCGVFAPTYGAKQGKGCSLCGTMMFSEIRAAGCPSYYDPITKSNIAYCAEESTDGYTAAGTWISYNDLDSHADMAKYAIANKLKGAFVFDLSEDTRNFATGESTYEITNQYRKLLK